MKHLLQQFTHKYQLSKTLRFELVPQFGTEKLVRTLFAVPEKNHHETIRKDLELSKSYKKVKQLLDCRHREIIDNTLSGFKFSGDELEFLNGNKTEEDNSDDITDNKKKDPLGKLREKVSKVLDAKSKVMFESKIINKEKNAEQSGIEEWLDSVDEKYLELGNSEKINREEIKEDLKKMRGFFTYFEGFKENRKNVYSKDKIATSVPFRILHDNFPVFKRNIENYEKIKKDHPDLVNIINARGADEIFTLDYFNQCLTQGGIDIYNKEKLGIVAKEQGREQEKGINQIINEYVQQKNRAIKEKSPKGEKPKKIKIATFDKLKKQILSISKTKSFQFKIFEDTPEIIEAINKRYEFLTKAENGKKNLTDEIKDFLNTISSYDLEEIYLNEKFISILSKKLFDYGRYIEFALEKWYDDKINKSGNDKRKFLAKKQHSIQLLQDSINHYLDNYEQNQALKGKFGDGENLIVEYFKNPTITVKAIDGDKTKSEEKSLYEELAIRKTAIDYILNENYTKDLKEEKDTDGVNVKTYLDALFEFNYLLSPFLVKDNSLEKDEEFYNEQKRLQELLFEADILALYNQTRNYITQKTYMLDKFKLTFGRGYFLSGWTDEIKEKEGMILINDIEGKKEYYLMISEAPLTGDEKERLFKTGSDNQSKICLYEFQKMDMKNFPRMFINSTGNTQSPAIKKYNLPIETIWDDYQEYRNGSTKEKEDFLSKNTDFRHRLIDYFKICAPHHESLAPFKHLFNSVWKPTKDYSTLAEFYKDTLEACYKIEFKNVNFEVVKELSKSGKLHLFKIHNKDFNPGSTGTKNLHTLYWEMLFDQKNLDNVVFKLNGGAELFYREASIKKEKIYFHKEGIKVPKKFLKLSDGILEPVPAESIKNLNAYFEGRKSKNELTETDLKYIDNVSIIKKKDGKEGIIKDERFTKDKIQFHCSIAMNFKDDGENVINNSVLDMLHKNDDIHIIGLDRGERHLIYLTMINKKGEIVDGMQFSLNELERRYKADGKGIVQKIDFNKLLTVKEGNRAEARKNWQTVENIKNLKEGYLSLVIHQLAKLIVDKKAIVVMEDLNYGFKDSRAKVEKQIYQKFENMLIKKLQYLVLDKKNLYEEGGVLKGYQLTNQEIPSYKFMSKQNGFLFYVPADYTSKICPVTGFVNLLNTKFTNRDNAIEFLKKFDKIYYDTKNDYFRFEFDYKNFDKLRVDIRDLSRTKWSVCSHPAKRVMAIQINNQWKKEFVDVNKKLTSLFEKVDYKSGKCLIEDIAKIGSAKFFEDILHSLTALLSLRHTYKDDEGIEHDSIVSSVELIQGSNEFYVSDEAGNDLPQDADANGAYNIAQKGLWLLNQLDSESDKEEAIEKFNKLKKAKEVKDTDDTKKKKKVSQWCPNKEWLAFAQSKPQ